MRRSQTYWLGASKLATSVAVISAFKLERRGRVRRRRGAEDLARARADLDRPLRDPRRGEAGHGSDRAEQRDDRRQVVRPHVEQRAGPVREEDVRVRVPRRLAPEEHRRARRQRLADRTLVDQRASGLVGAAEEDVRRAADPQPEPAPPRRRATRLPPSVVASGFSVYTCLPAASARLDDGDVRVRRRRQVQHDVDRRVGDELLDGEHVEAVLLRPAPRCATGRGRRRRRRRTRRTRARSARTAG